MNEMRKAGSRSRNLVSYNIEKEKGVKKGVKSLVDGS